MNQNNMPRADYTITKTGITIGCAHIPKPYLPMDEDDQNIQEALCPTREECSEWTAIVLYSVAVLAVLACFAVNPLIIYMRQ